MGQFGIQSEEFGKFGLLAGNGFFVEPAEEYGEVARFRSQKRAFFAALAQRGMIVGFLEDEVKLTFRAIAVPTYPDVFAIDDFELGTGAGFEPVADGQERTHLGGFEFADDSGRVGFEVRERAKGALRIRIPRRYVMGMHLAFAHGAVFGGEFGILRGLGDEGGILRDGTVELIALDPFDGLDVA